nr:uncharacterized protein LOC123275983 [Equus asinus]
MGKRLGKRVRSDSLTLISRRKTRVEAIFENIGQISVSVVTKHCQSPVTPSLGGDARVPRPGSRAWLPLVCNPRPAAPRTRGSAVSAARGRGPRTPDRHFSGGRGACAAADGALGDPGRRSLHSPARLPASALQGAPRLGTAVPARRREEAGGRGNNVVGCFADCQPGSRILLSTPLGLTATGPARRGKSPLIWSWKERGKVILRCLRRWVIGPQRLARARAQRRLAPVDGAQGTSHRATIISGTALFGGQQHPAIQRGLRNRAVHPWPCSVTSVLQLLSGFNDLFGCEGLNTVSGP